MRIAVITPFGSFDEAYSLAHVVAHQVRALRKAGHHVTVAAGGGCGPLPFREQAEQEVVELFALKTMSPDTVTDAWEGYRDSLDSFLSTGGFDVAIAHDMIFQSHYVDFAKAMHERKSRCPVVHYVHSSCNVHKKRPSVRATLPEGDTLVVPNAALVEKFKEYYGSDAVEHATNPHDPLHVLGVQLTPTIAHAIHAFGLLEGDVRQVYPVCSTRMAAKGVHHLTRVFAAMKARGASVKLIIVDANSRGEDAATRRDLIREVSGLTVDELLFTSDTGINGLKHAEVCNLHRLCNTFVFPTLSEAGPLALAEAQMHGHVIAVNSGMAPMLQTCVVGGTTAFHLPRWEDVPSIRIASGEHDVRGQAAADLIYASVGDAVLRELDTACQRNKTFAIRRHSLQSHARELLPVLNRAIARYDLHLGASNALAAQSPQAE